MKTTGLCAIAAFTLVASSADAAAPNMQEGLWEMVVKTEVGGAAAPTSGETVQRCMTAKDFSDPRKLTEAGKNANQCDIANYRMQGGIATWDVTCKGAEPMKGTGTITLQGDRYTGAQRMKRGGENVTVNYAGRYLGPCRAGKK